MNKPNKLDPVISAKLDHNWFKANRKRKHRIRKTCLSDFAGVAGNEDQARQYKALFPAVAVWMKWKTGDRARAWIRKADLSRDYGEDEAKAVFERFSAGGSH
jgi:hypothetical protein